MEPVTHFLAGAVLSRCGFNRKTAYSTLAMTLAAEAPDLDVLWSVRGPVAALQHHRGWTHTLAGAPVVAAAVVGVVWLFDTWRRRRGKTISEKGPPARWGLLWLFSMVAVFSHILLDYTNNYGVRPFFPFQPKWYAGNVFFIFEPLVFLLLLAALVMPSLFALADSEVGARRQRFRGRGWAIFAMMGIVLLAGFRIWERETARRIVEMEMAEESNGPVVKMSLSPYPVNPFQWHAVVETPLLFQIAAVDTREVDGESFVSNPEEDIFYKPPVTPALQAAKASRLGKVYLDWSQFPLVREVEGDVASQETVVQFDDLRFYYDVSFFHGREDHPLGGQVTLNRRNQVVAMELNGHEQK